MAHVRKSIRDNIVTTVTGLASTGTNVFPSRIRPAEVSTLPCLLVYTVDEQIDLEAGTFDAPQRNLTVRITGHAQDNTTLDDTLDQIAAEVEAAIGADITRGGYAIATDLQSSTVEFSGDGNKESGAVHLDYLVKYRTPFGDPQTVA